MKREQLVVHLNDFLKSEFYKDYAPNGLQVEGKDLIKNICTAVTASEQTIKEAIQKEADALLVHHGFFWRGEAATITGMKRQRIGQLVVHDLNLLAYHLPLDCHPVVGNNVCFGKKLFIENMQSHVANQTEHLLWSGSLARAYSGDDLSEHIAEVTGRKPLHLQGQSQQITRVAWCTGAAQDFIGEAAQLGVDAYLSGEVSERTYYQAKELGVHYFACGHHATERYGIQALGDYLAERFGLAHEFIDSENPV